MKEAIEIFITIVGLIGAARDIASWIISFVEKKRSQNFNNKKKQGRS